ncbi:MAG: TonB-dependent receptor [Muribaculaceae bacterium]|nr:TonB-dependent receptor [Muribaculaceae bacterium]
MKLYLSILLLACVGTMAAQEAVVLDSTDVFFRHIELKQVVVTGPTGAVKMQDMSMPVGVVDRNSLRMSPATNIVDAVAKLPGVSQVSTGSGISKPVIRGLGYNRVLVVADGVRQEGQQWGDEHGVEIDGNAVSSVEVLKGPASLLYGSDALAGVLKLNTDPVVPLGKMRLNVNSEYHTNSGLVNYSFNFGGNKQGLSWNVRYGDKFAHAYKTPIDGYVPNSQFRERAFSGMLGVNKTWGHTRVTGSYFHLTPSIAEGERDPLTGELVQPYADTKTYHHGLPYQQVYHYKAVLDNSFYLGEGRLNAVLAYQQNRRQEFEEPDQYGLYLKLHTVNYNVHYVTRRLGEDWRITSGVSGMWQRSLNEGDEFLIPDYNLFDFGAFITTTANVGNWALNGGVRFDNRHLNSRELMDDGELRFVAFKRNFNGFTASVGAVWHVTGQLDLRANAARGFRAPNISELASNGVHEGSLRYEVGNHDLKPEFSLQFDLGAELTTSWLDAQLSLFSNRIDNYIFIHRTGEVYDDEFMTYRYDSGDAQLLGGEFAVDIHPWHFLHLGTSFALVNAVQLHQPEESKYLPFTPAPRWQSDIKWEILHDGRVLNNAFVSLGVDYNFKQDHYYRADDTETATPAYCLLNAAIGTDIMFKGHSVACLSIMGTNLTNKAYQSHLSRLKYADVNPVTRRQGVLNMGRNIIFKLTVPLEF